MRGRKNPPLDLTPAPDGTPLTFDKMATAYLQDYQLQRYRSLTTARARVEHLRGFLGGRRAEKIGTDTVRDYQRTAGSKGRKPRRSIVKPQHSAACFRWRSAAG
jgi:hypothetical protein